jgi:hypothetical protein
MKHKLPIIFSINCFGSGTSEMKNWHNDALKGSCKNTIYTSQLTPTIVFDKYETQKYRGVFGNAIDAQEIFAKRKHAIDLL